MKVYAVNDDIQEAAIAVYSTLDGAIACIDQLIEKSVAKGDLLSDALIRFTYDEYELDADPTDVFFGGDAEPDIIHQASLT